MDAGEVGVVESIPSGPRLTRTGREAMGRRLSAMRGDRHFLRRTAAADGFSERWLRELRRRAEAREEERAPGRPRTDAAERARVRALVAEVRARLGETAGARTIHRVLSEHESHLSRTLVREELAALKLKARTTAQHAIEEARIGFEVLGRDTIWGEDTSHLARFATGEEITGELIRDRATLSTVSLTVGGAVTAESVLADLQRAAIARGGWPLAIQVDNASVYLSQLVRDELDARKVVLLLSRVHTPTDNGATEHGHHEFKAETGLGKGVVLSSDAEAAARLERARGRIDEQRPRPSRGWMTAQTLDRVVPRADTVVERAAFHAEACSAMAAAALAHDDPDEACEAARDAFFATLSRHGLARRHVGLRPREGAIPLPERRPPPGAPSAEG